MSGDKIAYRAGGLIHTAYLEDGKLHWGHLGVWERVFSDPAELDNAFEVIVDLSSGLPKVDFGASLFPVGELYLVKHIKDSGAIAVWNRANPDKKVQEGDYFVEMNRVQGRGRIQVKVMRKDT